MVNGTPWWSAPAVRQQIARELAGPATGCTSRSGGTSACRGATAARTPTGGWNRTGLLSRGVDTLPRSGSAARPERGSGRGRARPGRAVAGREGVIAKAAARVDGGARRSAPTCGHAGAPRSTRPGSARRWTLRRGHRVPGAVPVTTRPRWSCPARQRRTCVGSAPVTGRRFRRELSFGTRRCGVEASPSTSAAAPRSRAVLRGAALAVAALVELPGRGAADAADIAARCPDLRQPVAA